MRNDKQSSGRGSLSPHLIETLSIVSYAMVYGDSYFRIGGVKF